MNYLIKIFHMNCKELVELPKRNHFECGIQIEMPSTSRNMFGDAINNGLRCEDAVRKGFRNEYFSEKLCGLFIVRSYSILRHNSLTVEGFLNRYRRLR